MRNPQKFITWSLGGGPPVISTPREIDIANRDQLLHALLVVTTDAPVVVVDMTATTLCEATGIDILAWLAQWLNDHGGELRLVCTPQVLRVLTVTRTDHLFRILDSLSDALAMNRPYPQPHDQDLLAFAQRVAPRLGPGRSRMTECPWCRLTLSAAGRQLEREYEQALRCHHAYKEMVTEFDQDDSVSLFGSATASYRPAHARRLDDMAA